MAKITEKAIRTLMTECNNASKHLPVGLRGSKDSTGYIVELIERKGGGVHSAMTELKAGEAHAAVSMFNTLAVLTAPPKPFKKPETDEERNALVQVHIQWKESVAAGTTLVGFADYVREETA